MYTVTSINECTMSCTGSGQYPTLEAAQERANLEVERARRFVRVVVEDARRKKVYETRGER